MGRVIFLFIKHDDNDNQKGKEYTLAIYKRKQLFKEIISKPKQTKKTTIKEGKRIK
jgi:hypothetical protein